jgi:hypothetical protein
MERRGMKAMTVANRIMFNVTSEFPGLDGMKLFAEAMSQVGSLDVIWDMTVMSHGQNKGMVSRAIEVVLYRDDEGNHKRAETILIGWLKHHNLPFHMLGEVLG